MFAAQVKYRYGEWQTVAVEANRAAAAASVAAAMQARDAHGERPLQSRIVVTARDRTAAAAS